MFFMLLNFFPGGEVAVDALLGREELHPAAYLARKRQQLPQRDGARPLRYRPQVFVVAVPDLGGCSVMLNAAISTLEPLEPINFKKVQGVSSALRPRLG